MDVINRLPCTRVHVEHRTVAFLMDIRLHGKFLGNLEHVADKRVIFRSNIIQGGNVLSGDDQKVHRRLWP